MKTLSGFSFGSEIDRKNENIIIRPSAVFVTSCPDCGEVRNGQLRCENCRYDYMRKASFAPRVITPTYRVTVSCSSSENHENEISISCPSGSALLIGRGRGSEVRDGLIIVGVPDTGISRRHLNVAFKDPILCTDMNSTNGTFIEGVAITPNQSQEISCPCEIKIGNNTSVKISVVS